MVIYQKWFDSHPLVEIRQSDQSVYQDLRQPTQDLASIFENLKSCIFKCHKECTKCMSIKCILISTLPKLTPDFHVGCHREWLCKTELRHCQFCKTPPIVGGKPRPVHVVTAFAVNSVSWEVVVLRTFVGGRWNVDGQPSKGKTLFVWGPKSCSYQAFHCVGSKPRDSWFSLSICLSTCTPRMQVLGEHS